MTDLEKIKSMKNNESVYFDMHQGGGAVCYKCNYMLLLFSIPLYGGEESYEKTFYDNEIESLLELASSWT